ncbi:Deoxycytidine monophosphate (dCMP) deaminase [Rhizophlyctis rosea]|nr:Deoxycytidine monophosphate (dCMP) deaminase [Rhizophlyctis rosea]
MLIGITGPSCAGKHSIADYLVKTHNFTLIQITPHTNSSPPTPTPPPSNSTSPLPPTTLTFHTAQDAATYATTHWTENHVLCPVISVEEWEPFRKRPFALLAAVDAPVGVRFERRRKVDGKVGLEEFVREDDELMFLRSGGGEAYPSTSNTPDKTSSNGTTTPPPPPPLPRTSPLHTHLHLADNRNLNTFTTLSALHTLLNTVQLPNPDRLRPNWDTYFMRLCDLAATRSNCMKRRVGAILVKDRRIIATGYNGTPRGVRNCSEGGCGRCNGNAGCGRDLDTCLCLHAEENALLEAGRERIQSESKTILYCNTCPCLGCAKKIVQTGVHEVVYALSYGMDEMSARLFAEAGVVLRQHEGLESVFGGGESAVGDTEHFNRLAGTHGKDVGEERMRWCYRERVVRRGTEGRKVWEPVAVEMDEFWEKVSKRLEEWEANQAGTWSVGGRPRPTDLELNVPDCDLKTRVEVMVQGGMVPLVRNKEEYDFFIDVVGRLRVAEKQEGGWRIASKKLDQMVDAIDYMVQERYADTAWDEEDSMDVEGE